ncbi:hypothetical protein FIV42_09035 [Persicimonas caeni]|uniref:LPS export ABC transporter periplasmic protein LptC n=1 Tax=Persicimonas caeni TaxID=2292766 RepID=A0A4Y6PRC8_PERCE|nr:hypothetical protein [Persicimonas caeni]QDG50871.1 hypothetical protein FIV42_09035 [Persicimonas caeni]QED32092.1 hypothetical protein FRD00_09030 [Persicimonas caeni]
MSESTQIVRSRLVGKACEIACTIMAITTIGALALPVGGHEPPRRPDVDAPKGPVLVEMGGWEIFAHRAVVEDAHLRLDGVYARRAGTPGWILTADRVQTGLAAAPSIDVSWWTAHGHVRLAGPDDLYVTAGQMVSVQPSRGLVFVETDESPSVVHPRWRLQARRIEVELASGRVLFEKVAPGGSTTQSRPEPSGASPPAGTE